MSGRNNMNQLGNDDIIDSERFEIVENIKNVDEIICSYEFIIAKSSK
jgi:alpha-tubulin suppressor-like RCC1 family protein